jgi:hypothetical protein
VLQDQLRQAVRTAGMDHDDPMMPLVTAFAQYLRFIDERITSSNRAAAEASQGITDTLVLTRDTANAEAQRFRDNLAVMGADNIRQVGTTIARAAEKALTSRVRVLARNSGLAAATILFVTAALCLGGGYRWGSDDATTGIQQTEWRLRAAFAHGGPGANIWALLMEANDITIAIKQCNGPNLIPTGTARSACSMPLWITLPDNAPPKEPFAPSPGQATIAPALPDIAPAATVRSQPQTLKPSASGRLLGGPVHFGP